MMYTYIIISNNVLTINFITRRETWIDYPKVGSKIFYMGRYNLGTIVTFKYEQMLYRMTLCTYRRLK